MGQIEDYISVWALEWFLGSGAIYEDEKPGMKSRDLHGHIEFEICLRQLESEKGVQDGCQRKG